MPNDTIPEWAREEAEVALPLGKDRGAIIDLVARALVAAKRRGLERAAAYLDDLADQHHASAISELSVSAKINHDLAEEGFRHHAAAIRNLAAFVYAGSNQNVATETHRSLPTSQKVVAVRGVDIKILNFVASRPLCTTPDIISALWSGSGKSKDYFSNHVKKLVGNGYLKFGPRNGRIGRSLRITDSGAAIILKLMESSDEA